MPAHRGSDINPSLPSPSSLLLLPLLLLLLLSLVRALLKHTVLRPPLLALTS